MNWDAIGAIAELIGAIAVILTLIYLSVQVRQSASAIFTQTLDALNARLATSRELSDIWLRGRRDITSLDELELEQFRAFAMSLINLSRYAYTHPRKEYDYYNENLSRVTQSDAGFRDILDSVKWSLPDGLYDQLTGGT